MPRPKAQMGQFYFHREKQNKEKTTTVLRYSTSRENPGREQGRKEWERGVFVYVTVREYGMMKIWASVRRFTGHCATKIYHRERGGKGYLAEVAVKGNFNRASPRGTETSYHIAFCEWGKKSKGDDIFIGITTRFMFAAVSHVVMTVRSAGDASKLANFGSWPPAVRSYSAWGRLSLRSKQPSTRVD
ncbi:hypothetical protein MCOR03_010014 [Pyricularia oryzae]|uniref:Uncharacterized protein n=2 Tax=Pyricularia TaxID=48558 RepID=A0ABQ8NZU8_PYRGI|nr:hypothetical protein MCOR19_011227 [Pyricularia oryzae]KAI6303925.1 hypothetical protein MCOR33_000909 [Pyricularia grisea]KAI6331682.1 hypothetical protein MCOR28_011250 [Pyricularia oryzae]KAI6355445.1 hypothetical protein MCOR32_010270 [Pyricularia oryzae]KAI6361242.1 hypothetical protein MCOR31_008777 [Pyricularia oryzae]